MASAHTEVSVHGEDLFRSPRSFRCYNLDGEINVYAVIQSNLMLRELSSGAPALTSWTLACMLSAWCRRAAASSIVNAMRATYPIRAGVMSDEDRAPQARGQKRKWPLQEQAPTVPDAPAVKRGHRWPVSIRMLATSLLNVSMGIQNYYTMVQTQVVPKDAEGEGVMRAAYQTVYAGVRDFMWIDGDCEGTVDREDWEANTMPSLKAVRQMAKKYALRSITDGSVLDEPPHLPDYKDEARKPYLEELVELLRLGYPDDNGEYRVYRTIEHACAINNQIMHLCFTSLGLGTYRSVWLALKKHCPAIYRGLLQSKKKRDKLKTQVCLSTLLPLLCSLEVLRAREHGCMHDAPGSSCLPACILHCILCMQTCLLTRRAAAPGHMHAELRQASARPASGHLSLVLQD
jgi:hypothetical protein